MVERESTEIALTYRPVGRPAKRMKKIRVESLSTEDRFYADILNDLVVLAEEYQTTNQFDNYSAKLCKDPITNKIYYCENLLNDYALYEIEDDDNLTDNYDNFLKEQVSEWIGNSDDPIVESIAWGHTTPEDYKADPDYVGDCQILVIGSYYGYQPINWVTNNHYEAIIFSSAAEAQKWIDNADDDVYSLQHNEAGRPDYYIIQV